MKRLSYILCCFLLAGCATTQVTVNPPAQAPVCAPAMPALVQWSTQWRPDQKDVPEREKAAEAGLHKFLQSSHCFASYTVQRLPVASGTTAVVPAPKTRVVTVTVRELGPVLKLFSSLALVDGGTDVVLDIAVQDAPDMAAKRQFTVHWTNGGAGVVKGVASLPDDMASALTAGMQPQK